MNDCNQAGRVPTVIRAFTTLIFFVGTATAGEITITKNVMTDKTKNAEVATGYADAALAVEFKADATCSCTEPNLEFTWYFDDGNSAMGKVVTHTYGDVGAGNRSPYFNCKCKFCNATKDAPPLDAAVIKGINVKKIGDKNHPVGTGRLCYDGVRNVEAEASPGGVRGSDLIDWNVLVGVHHSKITNGASGDMSTVAAFPLNNSSWGTNTLYITIDSTQPSQPGQNGELNLTGTPSYIDATQSVKLFFDLKGTQNPDGAPTPNWFYYWKQTTANAGAMTYDAAGAGTGETRFAGGAWRCYLFSGACESAPPIWGGTSGIDFFANMCRHEDQHRTDMIAHWGAGANRVAAQDLDGDYLKDALEPGLIVPPPSYDPANAATFPDTFGYNGAAGGNLRDVEHYCLKRQAAWAAGSANASDWAKPGKQWP